jgi:hypothetical protein
VEWFDCHIGSGQIALHQAPEVLKAVGMYLTANVVVNVIHGLMDVFGLEGIVGDSFVGVDARTEVDATHDQTCP